MKARLPAGYGGGGMGNMQQMLRQAQKMQEAMAEKQAELEEKEYTTTAGGGVVEVTINGKKEITSLNLKPEIVDPDDVEMLQDLVMAAVNEAIRTVEDTSSAEMSKITGSMNMPGL
ncbi:MAG: YbaB/EbfC family nucleoid-associated protein [Oscillospiraceae bacterium]|nr:YbaB/EbfC family nucleoid-associated protein [Oscillospiraceae bacterium]